MGMARDEFLGSICLLLEYARDTQRIMEVRTRRDAAELKQRNVRARHVAKADRWRDGADHATGVLEGFKQLVEVLREKVDGTVTLREVLHDKEAQ